MKSSTDTPSPIFREQAQASSTGGTARQPLAKAAGPFTGRHDAYPEPAPEWSADVVVLRTFLTCRHLSSQVDQPG